jgi:hypothetical protein
MEFTVLAGSDTVRGLEVVVEVYERGEFQDWLALGAR